MFMNMTPSESSVHISSTGMHHVTSSPGNGGAEKAVWIAKSLMKKAVGDGVDPYLS